MVRNLEAEAALGGFNMRQMISFGVCPVCLTGGDVVAVVAVRAETLFWCCPSCESAWQSRPTSFRVDEINPPTRFAPWGYRLATTSDVMAAGLESLVVDWHVELNYDLDGAEGFQDT